LIDRLTPALGEVEAALDVVIGRAGALLRAAIQSRFRHH
jgi:hypothetical protein